MRIADFRTKFNMKTNNGQLEIDKCDASGTATLRLLQVSEDLKIYFHRDPAGNCSVRISGQRPTKIIRVTISKFFQGSVSEDFLPTEFKPIEGSEVSRFFLEKENFPETLFGDLYEGKATVSVTSFPVS